MLHGAGLHTTEPLSLASSAPPLIVPPDALGAIGSRPTDPTRLRFESTPANPNTNVCWSALKTVAVADFCMTPEPVPIPSDSIIRMMPDEVRTAVYWFVGPPVNASVRLPRSLLLEIGTYETDAIGYCCGCGCAFGGTIDSTSPTPAVIEPFEARTKLPAAAIGLLLLSEPENWNEYVPAGRRDATTATLA